MKYSDEEIAEMLSPEGWDTWDKETAHEVMRQLRAERIEWARKYHERDEQARNMSGELLQTKSELNTCHAFHRALEDKCSNLRAELAEANREKSRLVSESAKHLRSWKELEILLDTPENEVRKENERLAADIERKRARIVKLASREMGGLSLGYTKCLRDVLTILDDKETPSA